MIRCPYVLCNRSNSCWCAGMDNVRNMTGSPIAGLDPHEFVDSRPLCKGGHPLHSSQPPSRLACCNLSGPCIYIKLAVSCMRSSSLRLLRLHIMCYAIVCLGQHAFQLPKAAFCVALCSPSCLWIAFECHFSVILQAARGSMPCGCCVFCHV